MESKNIYLTLKIFADDFFNDSASYRTYLLLKEVWRISLERENENMRAK